MSFLWFAGLSVAQTSLRPFLRLPASDQLHYNQKVSLAHRRAIHARRVAALRDLISAA